MEGEYLYDRKWNIKEYDINNNIIYELKNGKGYIKELDFNNKLNYEGEYLYGLANGKGKIFNDKGKLFFEGECLNGSGNGKGKMFDDHGKLIFEGEFLYGFRIKGKEYYKGKLEYEGEYLYNNKFHGKGYDENGNIIYELINGNGKVKEYANNWSLNSIGC